MPEEAAVDTSAALSVAGAAPFACWWHAHDLGAGWVQVAGELDLATAPQLRRTLAEAQHSFPLVMLDLRDLAFMDSSGIHVIVAAAKDAKRDGGQLLVVRGSAQINRLLARTEVGTHVLIFDLIAPEPAPGLRLAPPYTEA